MSIPSRVLSVMLLGVLTGAGHARAEETVFEVTPFLGFRAGGEFEVPDTGNDLDLSDDASFGLVLSMAESEGGQYELIYSRQQTELEADTPFDMDVEYLHLGGLLPLGDEERYTPYIVGTFGGTRLSPGQTGYDDETRWSVALGGGVKIPFSERIKLRLELRGYVTFIDSDSSVFCVSAPPASGCAIQAKGDTFIQVEASAGVAFGF